MENLSFSELKTGLGLFAGKYGTLNSSKKVVTPCEGLKLTYRQSFWEISMHMLGTIPVYGRVWLADMVMLTLMITEDSRYNCALTTYYSSWTLSSNTEMCSNTLGAEVLWVTGHSLVSA